VINTDGSRSARCLKPTESVPDSFYNRRPMPRDPSLPVGRSEVVPPPTSPSDDDDPMPEGNMTAMQPDAGPMTPTPTGGKRGGGDCSVRAVGHTASDTPALLSLLGAGLALAWLRRARR
jgi:hypothetical protein